MGKLRLMEACRHPELASQCFTASGQYAELRHQPWPPSRCSLCAAIHLQAEPWQWVCRR